MPWQLHLGEGDSGFGQGGSRNIHFFPKSTPSADEYAYSIPHPYATLVP